jgi:hypothetical protein
MQPLPTLPEEPENLWFVIEKMGLDDAQLSGAGEPMEDDEREGHSDE